MSMSIAYLLAIAIATILIVSAIHRAADSVTATVIILHHAMVVVACENKERLPEDPEKAACALERIEERLSAIQGDTESAAAKSLKQTKEIFEEIARLNRNGIQTTNSN